jgi:3-carboxy-cis,cis-muconate cycloisomerase
MQTEIAEVLERPATPNGEAAATPPPRLRPSAAAEMAVTAALLAPQLVATILACGLQEHERAAAPSQAEWLTFPALALVTSGALGAIADLAQSIELDPDRMRNNLDLTQGQVMAEAITLALAAKISRQEAGKLVEEASHKAAAEKRSLQNVLADDPRVTAHLPGPVLARLFEPMSHLGSAQTFIDRLVGSVKAGGAKRV